DVACRRRNCTEEESRECSEKDELAFHGSPHFLWTGGAARMRLPLVRCYFTVPVPLSSNGVAASACWVMPSGTRRNGGRWDLPKSYADRPVSEYRPAPDLIPRSVRLVVSVIVHAPVGAGVVKQLPPS